jgi:hypothetical protein
MTDLKKNLNQVLEEHRHESGLHVIGGEGRLLDRLVQFFEEELKQKESGSKSKLEH